MAQLLCAYCGVAFGANDDSYIVARTYEHVHAGGASGKQCWTLFCVGLAERGLAGRTALHRTGEVDAAGRFVPPAVGSRPPANGRF